MRVDEPRQEAAPAEVDGEVGGRRIGRGADPADQRAVDDQRGVGDLAQFVVLSGEQADTGEQRAQLFAAFRFATGSFSLRERRSAFISCLYSRTFASDASSTMSATER